MATGSRERTALAIGPWGGTGGVEWDDRPHDEIQEIHLSHSGTAIGSFHVFYLRNGERRGGHNNRCTLEGFRDEQIQLFQGERIVKVSGNIGRWSWGSTGPIPVVRSLTFETDRPRTFGPYGMSTLFSDTTTDFNVPIENGFVAGFKGRSGGVLDAIGVYISPN